MRPIRLKVHGFTSFREPQEVDFEPLKLFAITGPTGAGKSSLLDAITFALYGAVPRMGRQNLAEMITHGQAEARVALEFQVDSERYRVARRLRRRGAQQATLERRDTEHWVDAAAQGGVRAIDDTVQELVKLDFESFCKAVMLPQGEFARFLKGEPKERRAALDALLGLKSFRGTAALAGERARACREGIDRIEEILAEEQYKQATEDAVRAAREEAQAAKTRANALSDALERARKEERLARELSEDAKRARGIEGQLDELERQLAAQQRECEGAEQSEREALAAHGTAQGRADESCAVLENAESRRRQLIGRLGTVEQLSQLRGVAGDLPGLTEELNATSSKADEIEGEQAACAEELQRLEHQSKLAEQTWKAAEERATQAAQRADSAGKRQQALERELDELRKAQEELHDAENKLAGARRGCDELQDAAKERGAAHRQAQRRLGELERSDMAAALAAGLAAGDPCPVCDRPLEAEPTRHAHARDELERAREACETARSEHEKALADAQRAAGELRALEQALKSARKRWVQTLSGRDGIAAVEDELATATEDADCARRAAEAEGRELQSARNDYEKLAGALNGERARAAEIEKRLKDARKVLEQARGRSQSARTQLQARFGEQIPADAHERLEADLKELKDAEKLLESARRDQSDAQKRLSEAEQRLQSARTDLARLDAQLDGLSDKLDQCLAQAGPMADEHPVPGLEHPLPALPARLPERARHAAQLAACARATAEALAALAEALAEQAQSKLEEILQGARTKGIEAADARLALDELRRAGEEALIARGTASARAKELAERLDQRRKLDGQAREQRARAEVLELLARELRADRFIEFVIQETLDMLAEHASEELRRISAGRYSLISADGEFRVLDHDNADEQRSVRTLSGGETFMASLAMALALSRHVSELAAEGLGARLEAVFIDEGFGALDPESLEEVLDALERLRGEEILVGVISHLPEVAARIGEGLEVRREGSGSRIVSREPG